MQAISTLAPERALRVCYLFKDGRRKRISEAPGGICHPDDFFYGYLRLDPTLEKDFYEEADLGIHPLRSALARRLVQWLFQLTGVHLQVALALASKRTRKKLNQYDVIFSTTNHLCAGLGLLHRLGALRAQPVCMSMGLISQDSPARWKRIYRWIFRNCVVVAISIPETQDLKAILGKDIHYCRFGIDLDFWQPADANQAPEPEPYVLSIGNDRFRDFQRLIDVWTADFPQLLLITDQTLDSRNKTNVSLRRGDWRNQVISDEGMRALYGGALFVVTPTKQTIQPSGQSVTLQTMASAKLAILADIAGLWDRQVMISGENCLLYAPEDNAALLSAIRFALANPLECERIGRQARRDVERYYPSSLFAEDLSKIFQAAGNLKRA